MNAEKEYLYILCDILKNGSYKEDRTGVGSFSVFGRSIRHKYEDGFPLLTTKKMFTKGIIGELLWFLKGTEDPKFLIDNNIHIWDEWIKENKLPHTYGVKWRNFDGVDQVQNIINQIKEDPNSRRLIVSAWDPRHISDAALPWCHILWQLNIELDKYKDPKLIPNDEKHGDISIAVYQRSADFFFGRAF